MNCELLARCGTPQGAAEDCGADSPAPCVVRPRGVLTGDRADGLEQLIETARHHAAAGNATAVLDLSRVELLGGAAIDVVLRNRKALEIRQPGPRVARQLALLKLDRLLLARPA